MDNEQPQSNGDAADDGGSTTKNEKKESKPAGLREWGLRGGALGNFAMQCVNVALASGPTRGGSFGSLSTTKQVGRGMLYGSSGLAAVNSPVVVYKERQLTSEDTFRTALNGIREEQGRLSEQNDVLSAEIDDLQSEVDRMKDVENALRELSETQGSQLGELMDLINQNKEINAGMLMVLRNKCLEEVITLVLDIDNDGSFTIQDKEIDRLIIGMSLIEEISFDKEFFREQVISCDGNVDEVISMIKSMIHGTSDSGCTIDIADPEDFFEKRKTGA
mmetsp:Transcript_4519/g.11389  ORF Transcript_4519/g.11389 Transcript_4519/m.11389 type:complete len:276 (-) Transcript_4519:65-892(-)